MIFMIAVIKDVQNNITGFRLIDTLTGKTIEATYGSVAEAITSGKARIENLKCDSRMIKGVNGALNRYPQLATSLQLIGKSPIIVISKAQDNKFICSDYKGNIVELTEENVIKYSKLNGIANGKIVDDNISSIEGEYRVEVGSTIDDKIEGYKAKCAMLGLGNVIIGKADTYIELVRVPKNVKKCIIPEFITKIGNKAFENCEELKEISISNGVKIIGESAFAGCKSLESLEIPDSVVKIGGYAFFGCSALKSIKLPKYIEEIAERTFDSCRNLTEIAIPSHVTKIEKHAFEACFKLESVKLNKYLTTIDDYAFYDCRNLRNIKIAKYLWKLGEYAFGRCINIEKIEIPPVNTINQGVFTGCTSLSNVTISTGTTIIERYSFTDCDSITSISIPASVTRMDKLAFQGCYNLKTIRAPKWLADYLKSYKCEIKLY